MNNKDFVAEYSTLVTFVRARHDDKTKDDAREQKKKQSERSTLSGEEAKRFYEETLKTEEATTDSSNVDLLVHVPNKRSKSKHVEKFQQSNDGKTPTPTFKSKVSLHDLLKVAQNGEVAKMKKVILNGADVNFSDAFGWNALMCAAHNGHLSMVKLLMENGADKMKCDTKGRDAVKLAKVKGYREVANFIEKYSYKISDSESGKVNYCSGSETMTMFFCPVCKKEFKDSSRKAHDSSTVHLFNLKLQPKEDPFVIPSSNVGYRLMMKSGWDGEKGLGPDNQGKRHPIKTVLKRDRACLGSEAHSSKKAKITHFGANDQAAVNRSDKHLDRKMSAKTLSKKTQKFREKKAKDWERNLRQYMSME